MLRGGRVIDPETGTDAVLDVGLDGTRIGAVGPGPLAGRVTLDVRGRVVAPGFIDLHSHAQGVAEHWLQALDGVTTALELECGAHPVEPAYRRATAEGRPIHYGWSASWGVARMERVAGLEGGGTLDDFLANVADPAWQAPATAPQLDALVDALQGDLEAGAVGVGVLIGYAPEVDPAEYLRVAAAAAAGGVPAFTHTRDLVEARPEILVDGATELVRAAGETGAHMHYCHLNSTTTRHVERVLALVERARAEGSAVSTEAYPYGAGMTGIGATFLAPERLAGRGLTPRSLLYTPTGERVADVARLEELRRVDPGGLAIVESLRDDRPEDFAFVERALAFPGAAVASDAMPLRWPGTPPTRQRPSWPLPPGAVTHPRTAGTFARVLRLVRCTGLLGLSEAIERCALRPARILGDAVPAMRAKGRLQPGCDADIVVFDPEAVTDQATYEAPTRPSTGIDHVLVGGTFVVHDGRLVPDARPGQPVRAATAGAHAS